MNKRLKTALLKYGITTFVCLVVAASFAFSGGVLELDLKNRYRILSDAFLVPGILSVFGALLVWLANEGAMDGVTWAVTNAFYALIPGLHLKRERYGDYVQRKRGKKTTGYGFLFIVGGVFLAASAVFTALFYGL